MSIELFLKGSTDLVSVTPPGSSEPVKFRLPTFAEWHAIAVAHRKLDGQDPPIELVIETVATCLADDRGNRLYKHGDTQQLEAASHRVILWLYTQAFATVLKEDEETVKDEEKK